MTALEPADGPGLLVSEALVRTEIKTGYAPLGSPVEAAAYALPLCGTVGRHRSRGPEDNESKDTND
ncbi:hypothetical protein [Streptomyces asiaticus]|uniref:hypothetical protein n=1 Tax=Streptomyces asiaticus TaxID=114695 RepID=UPI003D7485FC